MTRIVHVVPRLATSGPARSLAALVKWGDRSGLAWSHDVIALEETVSPVAVVWLRGAGARLHLGLDASSRGSVLAEADAAIVHFWQCPSMIELLTHPIPTRRVVVWVHTLGLHAPQVLASQVERAADALWCTAARTLDRPATVGVHRSTAVVRGLVDPDRLAATPTAHDGVVVGYVGTVNSQKMHPRFVELCARVGAPDTRFVVHGTGGGEARLRVDAERAGIADRLAVLGHTEDVGAALTGIDVLGYPLRSDTYASSDLAVQEAMWMGVPPVVLTHGGPPELVDDGVSGVVATDEAHYVEAVDSLARDRVLRTRMAGAAREHARAAFDPRAGVRRVDELLRALRSEGPQRDEAVSWGATPGAWFATALAGEGTAFVRALGAGPGGDAGAEAAIAAAGDLVIAGEGGLFQWRNAHPDDPDLRWWTSLVLDARGESERAAAERFAARDLRAGVA